MLIEIVTNNVPRPVVYGYELTEKEKKEVLDYLEEDELISNPFFRYKGKLYDMYEFDLISEKSVLKNWQGQRTHNDYTGLVFRYAADMEYVIVGEYFTEVRFTSSHKPFLRKSNGQETASSSETKN